MSRSLVKILLMNDRSKKLLLISWVNPNFLPPVREMAKVFKASAYQIDLITTNINFPLDSGLYSSVKYVDFHKNQSAVKRQLQKIAFIRKVKKFKSNYRKILVFDNYSLLAAICTYNKKSIFYNILELFDYSRKLFFRSPFDTTVALLSKFILTRGLDYSLPSPQRIQWIERRFPDLSNHSQLLYNAPFVSDNCLNRSSFSKDRNSLPVIIHTGGVTPTRCVQELISGFEAMKQGARLVITNLNDSHYSNEIKNQVALSCKKELIETFEFLSGERLVALRNEAAIGVCFTKGDTYDTKNIAPNKIGEYLSYGLYSLVNRNSYYDVFENSPIIKSVDSLSPKEIAAALDLLVIQHIDGKNSFDFQSVLKWYNMKSQIAKTPQLSYLL